MSTPPTGLGRLLSRARIQARRIVPAPLRRLDAIQDRISRIEIQQGEHLEHIRNLAQRVEALSARVDSLETNLNSRLDDLAERTETTVALGWDHIALVRRLAAIEDRLAVLEPRCEESGAARVLAG